MFKKQRLWIGGAGIVIGLLVLLIGLLWGLIARLLQLNRQQSQAGEQAISAAADRHSGKMTVQPAPSAQDASGADELSPEMLAAVMVAVRMHRRIRRNQAAPAMRTHQPGSLPSRWIGAGRAGQNQTWHPRHA